MHTVFTTLLRNWLNLVKLIVYSSSLNIFYSSNWTEWAARVSLDLRDPSRYIIFYYIFRICMKKWRKKMLNKLQQTINVTKLNQFLKSDY